MKIALISLDIVWEDKIKNKISISNIFNRISDKKIDIVIFPEMTMTGFTVDNKFLSEELETSYTILFFKEIAIKYNVNIIFGMLSHLNNKNYNSCIAMNQNGEIDGIYNKLHLFSYANENKKIQSGQKHVDINWNGGWGLTICYDLRFPELYQILSKKNSVIVNIANWPKSRIDHWKTLLKARAIENQSYIIGVNRIGTDGNNLEYEKSSLIIDPNGKCLASEFTDNNIDIYEIEIDIANEIRQNFQFKKDRLSEYYKKYI